VPLRKTKDSLTRQGMWNKRGPHRKGLAEREEKERVLSFERAHKQVLTMKRNMHLILNSRCYSGSTGTLVTVAIATVPDGGFYREDSTYLAFIGLGCRPDWLQLSCPRLADTAM